MRQRKGRRPVWLYYRFTLSVSDSEDLLAHRSITVSYESIRHLSETFGLAYAGRLAKSLIAGLKPMSID